uniref:cytochrome-c oxidase n=1 Tax=Metagonimus yokogawai TaxID=84529 RepID=V9NDT3_9TREM|nr:cytochrome c oxidase subunit II [Metagonimus yokogawai]AGN12765.1 cytochrome c oxidase subunit II [Metagonimus yokogawai]
MLIGNVIYDNLMFYMLCLCAFIAPWVFLVLGWQIFSSCNLSEASNESNWIEWAWTLIPTGMVTYLCLLNVVCMSEDLPVPIEAVIKVIGRQWLWSYEITGFEGGYDSIITDFIDSVDKPLRISLYDFYHLVVTSSDVIHCFTLPELNVKVDAIPGRVNQSIFYADRLGYYIGYCSELCGAGHAYMPIVLESVVPDYKPLGWVPLEVREKLLSGSTPGLGSALR